MEENKQNIDERKKDLLQISDEELWVLSSVADDTHHYDVDSAFERFHNRIHKVDKKGSTKIIRLKNWQVAAVAIVLLCFISVTSFWQGQRTIQHDFSDIIVEAPLGSKTKLQLPDGSTVWLNAGSRMVYSQGFGVGDRVLHFKGEAYFEVYKNKDLPFTIKTADVNITVLGTKFNFRNYEEDKEAVVDLLEGKVSLISHLAPQNVQYLVPQEKMVLDKKTGKMNIFQSDRVDYSADWTNNILLFDEDLVPDIVKELERSYNIKIEIVNKDLNNVRFYGSFDRLRESVDDILNTFTATGHLKYEKHDDVIYLY